MQTENKTISKTTQKYIDIVNSGSITESQIISMRSHMNKDKEAARAIFSAWDAKELELSADQIQKGFEFLMNAWKTPKGIERKNNPFGYREQKILENFRDITLPSLYDNSKYGQSPYYLPLYYCNSKDGNGFEYYYDGEIHIVG